MNYQISESASEMGRAAAEHGAEIIKASISSKGQASIILATGASQFEVLSNLTQAVGIDWSVVDCFHLDEYIGVTPEHPASFQRYLRERFVEQLPVPPKSFAYIDGTAEGANECNRVGRLIEQTTIDVAFIGIGENGHLAFNDPPADFETDAPYIVVELDEACRRQQLGEGWFPSFDDVPRTAISMSIRQILKSNVIICSVPDSRKSDAVAASIEGPITATCPASILQNHSATTIYLDSASAQKLKR